MNQCHGRRHKEIYKRTLTPDRSGRKKSKSRIREDGKEERNTTAFRIKGIIFKGTRKRGKSLQRGRGSVTKRNKGVNKDYRQDEAINETHKN